MVVFFAKLLNLAKLKIITGRKIRFADDERAGEKFDSGLKKFAKILKYDDGD